jgi:hypothetical protein
VALISRQNAGLESVFFSLLLVQKIMHTVQEINAEVQAVQFSIEQKFDAVS